MNRSGQLGTMFETAIVNLLKRTYWREADRLVKTGRLDRGDIRGPRGWTLEAKNTKGIDLPGFMAEARTEARNNGHHLFAVIQKARRGKNSSGSTEDAYFIVPLYIGAYLMRLEEIIREGEGNAIEKMVEVVEAFELAHAEG